MATLGVQSGEQARSVNGVRIAAVAPNGVARFYLTDQVDSVKVVVDDNGIPLTRFEYLPYGETWIQEDMTGFEGENTPKYNSQELDTETNFYFYNARHYDPEIARFVTADTVIDGEGTAAGWNRYMYVHGNPIVYKDPTGHFLDGSTSPIADIINRNNDAISNAASSAAKNISNVASKATDTAQQAINSAKEAIQGGLRRAKGKQDAITPSVSRQQRLLQTDGLLNQDGDNNMSVSGCYFRAIQAVAEEYVGKNLTADQINDAKKALQLGDNPAVRGDMYVNLPDSVLNDTFQRLGRSDLTGTVNWGAEEGQSADYTILKGQSGPDSYHFRTADSNENQIWDPAPGTKTYGVDEVRKVFIHKRPLKN